jgi:predicted 3-demethylubiquinone-9 3-methyltransferase (glyoxalase superfamily)
MNFYISVFKNSKILRLQRFENAGPAGGNESQCGWLKDKFGLSWQIVPAALGQMLGDKDPAKSKRVMKAMLQMRKIDIAQLRQAYEGR